MIDIVAHGARNTLLSDALVIASQDGRVRTRKTLRDLFNQDEILALGATGAGIRWCAKAWIDERRGSLVVVGSRHPADYQFAPTPFRVINMESGQVQHSPDSLLVEELSKLESAWTYAVVELAAERMLPAAKGDLIWIFSRTQLTTAIRMKAAVALARLGDRRGKEFIKSVAFGNAPESDDARRDLPAVIGDEAGPMMRDYFRRTKRYTDGDRFAMRTLRSVVALPLLVDLLAERRDSEQTAFALACLGDRGRDARSAVAQIAASLQVDSAGAYPTRAQRYAARALARIGPGTEIALPALAGLAEKYA